MTDRVALVTGASRGIGAAVARRLAEEGMRVVLVSRSGAPELAEKIEGLDVKADISLAEGVTAAFDAAEKEFGVPVSVLVNNAGITRDGLLLRMRDTDWDDVLATDLTSAMRTSRRALKGMMKQRWGRIVNIGSIVGLTGNPGQVSYAAAKAGLVGLTKSLAKEVASRNITVNLVAPGFVETSMTAVLKEDLREKGRVMIPMGRFGTCEEIAAPVVFLASEDASYISGSVLAVDGGLAIS